jgi:hypothetical protein
MSPAHRRHPEIRDLRNEAWLLIALGWGLPPGLTAVEGCVMIDSSRVKPRSRATFVKEHS